MNTAPHVSPLIFDLKMTERGAFTSPGIHIRSHPVILDDSKAVQTSEITPKVILRMSIVLNHNIFSKFSYNVV